MTDDSQRRDGPIRRRAGERRKDRETRRETADESGSKTATGGDEGGRDPLVVRRGTAGRRVFDPGSGPSGPRRTSAGESHGGGGRPGGHGGVRRRSPGSRAAGGRGRPDARGRDATDAKKLAEQREAEQLARDKGIPQPHALRVVRGEISLNEILKQLMRKERAQRLVERDGLDPGLAGQVASGHLTRERALLLQRMRKHRSHRIDRDAFKVAAIEQRRVAVAALAGSWQEGVVKDARTYELDLVEGEGLETLQKHDIMLLCDASDADAVRAAIEVDKDIRVQGLAGTPDREQRVRAPDEALIELVESGQTVRCVLRDGSILSGPIRSFGRWDLRIEVADGILVDVLFHALHPLSSEAWDGATSAASAAG